MMPGDACPGLNTDVVEKPPAIPYVVGIYDVTGQLVIDVRARQWCRMPYPDHPNGCPNYGQRPTCPPEAPLLMDWIDLAQNHWLAVVGFDLRQQVNVMRAKHPTWTVRQARCLLYWQPSVNRHLRLLAQDACRMHPGTVATLCPEAMGVQVIRSARRAGVPIKPRPTEAVYKVALLGYPIAPTGVSDEACTFFQKGETDVHKSSDGRNRKAAV